MCLLLTDLDDRFIWLPFSLPIARHLLEGRQIVGQGMVQISRSRVLCITWT